MSRNEHDEIYNSLHDIENETSLNEFDKCRILFKLLDEILNLFVASESIRFTTLFAKISWIITKYQLNPRFNYLLQNFRRAFERGEINTENVAFFAELGLMLCYNLLANLNKQETTRTLTTNAEKYFKFKPTDFVKFKAHLEGLIVEIDSVNKIMLFIDSENPHITQTVVFDVADRNEMFTNTIISASKILTLPFHINLIDVNFSDSNTLHPTAFVLNPDYLVDVTSVANSTRDSQGEYWLYILNKLLLKENGINLMIGNLAGNMLDEIIENEDIAFNHLLTDFFKSDPLKWASFDDKEVADAVAKLQFHFLNIKRTVQEEFKSKNILKEDLYLEPSFYCRDYGIQGRLDLLHVNKDNLIDIVELKSGKPFKPNIHGINNSHYLQTLLYDLIIKSTYFSKSKSTSYIMYSSLSSDSMKYAPVTKSQQYELMKIRNEIMIMEHALAKSEDMASKIVSYLKTKNFIDISGYTLTNLQTFEDLYSTLDTVEKKYFTNYVSFIAREQILAKTGEFGTDKSNGLSGLWLETVDEKEERFAILNHLQIVKNYSAEKLPIIEFALTDYSAKLSNFRVGDIAVVYPHSFNSKEIMHHQIFKANIVDINETSVIIKLRHSQKNQQVFRDHDFWNLEQDVLDSSFRHMYKNLFLFASASPEKRQLILGRQRPAISKSLPLVLPPNLTLEQKSIIQKLYFAEDYMLLWGPPGTGKTSEIIKNLSLQIFNNTEKKIMLLAYTNKAVDEMCHALVEGGLKESITRIGSALSVGESYRDILLNEKISKFKSRKEIIEFLSNNRIYVSTVSSLLGKLDLFDLVEFDTLIVDEASQILEPMLCGILSKFRKFILIGDHKQLPAVVAQKNSETIIKNKELKDIGIIDTRVSLFERLFIQIKKESWYHASEILSQQGRMHSEIMDFVNVNFYENKLMTIPQIERLNKYLHRSFNSSNIPKELLNSRMVFIGSQIDKHFNTKTNIFEAKKVVEVINFLIEIYKEQGIKIHENSIGVITPYRAQIALIKAILNVKLPILVDTVERYQGGAKDIIILSLCTNKISQLNTLISKSSEGVDRKLNVAITRTKEQLIVIGNEEILSNNKTYKNLIEKCVRMQ